LGVIGQMASLGSITWDMIIALQIYFFVSLQHYTWYKKPVIAHIFAWTLILCSGLIPLALQQYGPTTTGCWISNLFPLTRALCFYLPLVFCYGISLTVVTVVLVKRKVYSKNMEIEKKVQEEYGLSPKIEDDNYPTLQLLVTYTLVFIISWIPSLILYILALFRDESWSVTYTEMICSTLQGLGHALVWGSSGFVRDLYLSHSRGDYVDLSSQNH